MIVDCSKYETFPTCMPAKMSTLAESCQPIDETGTTGTHLQRDDILYILLPLTSHSFNNYP